MTPTRIKELSESQVWLAEQAPTGFLVALWLAADAAASLVVTGGEKPETLHVTLAYCGDASEMNELVQARVITAIDETVRYRDQLEGTVAGFGRFDGTDGSDDKDVFYATPDIPRLAELRQDIVDCLLDKGVSVSSNHGWVPHITLAYLDPADPNPVIEVEDLSLTFSGVTVMSGLRRVDIPFWTPEPTYSLSESGELPLDAPLGTNMARALYFGNFDKPWIPFLPKPDKYVHEIFGNLDFTPETYNDVISNFDKYVYKQDLPIKATHTDPSAGAIGWIRPGGMRLAEDGSIEVKPEWNELGKGLVKDDRFLYTSAEFCKVWTNPVTQERIPNVAVGLALVTRPHFKTDVLNPLSESEALAFAEASSLTREHVLGLSDQGEIAVDLTVQESGKAREGTTMPEEQNAVVQTQVVDPGLAAVTAPAAVSVVTTPVTTTDANAIVLSDLTQVIITAKQRTQERQMFADLTTRVELAERRATTAEAELKRIEAQRRKDKFTAEVVGRSAENGQPWFGDPEANVHHLVSLAESYGDDSPEVRWAVTQKRNEAQAIRNTGIFDPISNAGPQEGASASAQITHFAEQIRHSHPNLSADEAVVKAYEEHPELYVKSLKR